MLALGSVHACYLLLSGGVKCVGSGEFRQLGNNDTLQRGDTPETVPRLLPLVALPGAATMICAGLGHSCAVVDGDVFCWGDK